MPTRSERADCDPMSAERTANTPGRPHAVLVAGMHRSGTSMTARVLGDCGLSLGEQLLAPDRYNVVGYYEDLDFLRLGMRMATACCDHRDRGHHDWGITESERLDRAPLAGFRDEASELVEAARKRGAPWGFKDPRATLFLDFWQELVPEASFVFVFRPPWDVIASTGRIEGGPFASWPGLAAKAWRVYNRELLEFARRSRERSVVLPAAAFLLEPDAVAQCLAARLGDALPALDVDAPRLPQSVEPALLSTARPGAPEVALARRLLPDADELLGQLYALSDVQLQERRLLA